MFVKFERKISWNFFLLNFLKKLTIIKLAVYKLNRASLIIRFRKKKKKLKNSKVLISNFEMFTSFDYIKTKRKENEKKTLV